MTAIATDGALAGAMRRRSVGPPAARSVLMTVLGEYVMPRGGVVWQERLIAALVTLGHTEQTARQAVARSTRDGWLSGERRGRRTRMAITPETKHVLEEGRERIFGFGRESTWDERWLVVVLRIPEERRRVRHHVRTRLARAGMGSLGGGVWIAPHADREPLVADALRAADASAEAVSFMAGLGTLGRAEDLLEAWDLDGLRAEYAGFLDRFDGARPRDGEATFRTQTELVHAWRRIAFLDPDLPDELLPRDWPRRRAYELFHRRHATWHGAAQDNFGRLDDGEPAPTRDRRTE
ncbi:MAG TPA: PaaX family transcriptional regulator C-terminal domain-containing protein [Gaiellaceae bacterium]|nr:PaaX family transcriptional regulator C-terminal domain-containing protein [Gaiellaceae bacterium]